MSESDFVQLPALFDAGALSTLLGATSSSNNNNNNSSINVDTNDSSANTLHNQSDYNTRTPWSQRPRNTTTITTTTAATATNNKNNGINVTDMTSSHAAAAAAAAATTNLVAIPGPTPSIDKQTQRRAGKYTHPFGGMRRFAEDRAKHSGWDVACLNYETADIRKGERALISDAISDQYKEAFIQINVEQGKGRPKANNISAAKKTVKMIAERVLLALEARATQMMFSEITALRRTTEQELQKLRQIDACGKENPLLTYDEIRNIVREKLNTEECHSDEFLPGEKLVRPETAVYPDAQSQPDPVMNELVDDDDANREALKQALVEMRAEEIQKGIQPTLISTKWVEQLTAAAVDLVRENYAKQFAPMTNATMASSSNDVQPALGCPHFRRKNRVLMACCGTFPVCRMCHFQDQSRIHDIRVEPVETMLCVMCGNVQPKAQYCTRCKVKFGEYYCDICGITDDPKGVNLRHCDRCNVCMPGLTFHCDLCKACFSMPEEEHFQAVHGHGSIQNGPTTHHSYSI